VRIIAAVVVVLAVALLVSEAAMQPATADRIRLVAVFGAVGVLAAGVAHLFGRWSPRSLRSSMIGTALVAVGVTAVAVIASATSMFLSSHDLVLVLVAVGLGVALGIAVARTVTRDLQRDLAAIRATARGVARGQRSVRTGVTRSDELGALARTLDDAIEAIEHTETEREELDAAQRRYFANISHDLRTPLTSLRSAIEAMQDGLADDPDRYLAAMARDVELLSSLVEDLFLLARIQSGGLELDRQTVDLAELADGVVDTVRPYARQRGVQLCLEGRRAVPVDASLPELSRVLKNLLDNAVRHSPDGSTVRVVIGADGGPTLTVSDEGPGFPDDFLANAFDLFTRADEARVRDGGGAGLGLAIARGLVEAHGGDISARPGPGGVVTVRLPQPFESTSQRCADLPR
jgi:two-component system, OmpR family, sensor histidine kinase BaeS